MHLCVAIVQMASWTNIDATSCYALSLSLRYSTSLLVDPMSENSEYTGSTCGLTLSQLSVARVMCLVLCMHCNVLKSLVIIIKYTSVYNAA